ncbi:hypothetical protein [Candidatus Contubernalis alkaliaceticus]|uniref:hypothetical protein n=1 Tax=Candidatus Contubernalis alkaliaceticus TaxID=338645 RepID=UPI001F4C2F92|nr:hypothetical protein [Candidatus Contubernalis alkalaceticus]UNC91635.1 hypothetical protein HUE98_05740 [Candidatus Contubernalis alkalaceticus]
MGLFESFLYGVLGQGIRALIGIKKQLEEANKSGKNFEDWFNLKLLLVSLIIGGIAGIIGLMLLDKDLEILKLMIIATGYAGADFIEGLFNSLVKKLVE